MYIITVLPYSDSYMHLCLAYICEVISTQRIYIAVTSSYPRDRDITGDENCKMIVNSESSINVISSMVTEGVGLKAS